MCLCACPCMCNCVSCKTTTSNCNAAPLVPRSRALSQQLLCMVCVRLCVSQDYNYEFFAPQPDSEPIMIAASPNRPVDPVKAVVNVPNNE
jgi:hypothetical protein